MPGRRVGIGLAVGVLTGGEDRQTGEDSGGEAKHGDWWTSERVNEARYSDGMADMGG